MLAGVDPSSVFLGIRDPVKENPKCFPNRLLTNCKDVKKGKNRSLIPLYCDMNALKFIKTFINSPTASTQCDLNGAAAASVPVKVKLCIQQEEILKG